MNNANEEYPSLLLVDDDEIFTETLSSALRRRGYVVRVANSVKEALSSATSESPEYAVIDLNMKDGSGLEVVKRLKELDPNTRMVVLTGFASVATAVEAIKLGATHYLAKPADTDEVLSSLHRDEGNTEVSVSTEPMSVNRLEWEHIQRVLLECNGNISETARRLNMHRRTLQRKLSKHPVRK